MLELLEEYFLFVLVSKNVGKSLLHVKNFLFNKLYHLASHSRIIAKEMETLMCGFARMKVQVLKRINNKNIL